MSPGEKWWIIGKEITEIHLRNWNCEWYSQNKRGLQGHRRRHSLLAFVERSEHIWYFYCIHENQVNAIIRRKWTGCRTTDTFCHHTPQSRLDSPSARWSALLKLIISGHVLVLIFILLRICIPFNNLWDKLEKLLLKNCNFLNHSFSCYHKIIINFDQILDEFIWWACWRC